MTGGRVCLRRWRGSIAAFAMLALAARGGAQSSAAAGGAVAQGANARAQTADAAQLPRFDVASVKPHKSEGMQMMAGFRATPDGISVMGVPLGMLLRQAFGLPEDRILNVPDWVNSARYDIEAKVDPDDAPKLDKLTQTQRMEMLVPLLEGRFGLKFHHETKTMEVYALVVAKSGPKLKAATDDEGTSDTGKGSAGAAPPPPPPPGGPADGGPKLVGPGGGEGRAMAAPDRGTKPPPGAMMQRVSPEGMTMEARGVTTDQLARMISMNLGSTVVNETGLKGKYDYTFSFAPEMGGRMMGMPPPGAGDSSAPPPPQGPSIFTAVEEQLGLKLEGKREPVDVVVIDHIEQPSPN
jgi:uncharacterized protein (TIGR03435 family)